MSTYSDNAIPILPWSVCLLFVTILGIIATKILPALTSNHEFISDTYTESSVDQVLNPPSLEMVRQHCATSNRKP